MTNINEYIVTSSMFNDDNKELTTIENNNNTINNNLFLNTCGSFDGNQTLTYGNRTNTNKENSKISYKGEEICKNSKNLNDIINKQLPYFNLYNILFINIYSIIYILFLRKDF